MNVSNDWLIVEYDANKISVPDMLKTIDKQNLKLTGKIVPDP